MFETELSKLAICYSAIFEKGYRPCDTYFLTECILGVIAVVLFWAVIKSYTKKVKSRPVPKI